MSTPTVVRAAAPIPLPLDVCWQKLRDLTRARDYVPGLRDSVIRTERKEGVGASRVVSHAQFGDMDETVIAWDEGVGLTVRLHQGDRPARPFAEAARQVRGTAAAHQVDGAKIAIGHAYGGGSQFFAMWAVGSKRP